MTTMSTSGQGVRSRVADPDGTTHLLHAVPSGTLVWPVYAVQTPLAWVVETVGTKIVHRLVFRRGWTVLAWRSDALAPKRQRVYKQRYPGEAQALAALERLAGTISASGLPPARGAGPGAGARRPSRARRA
jgi:hypothetical protein